VDNPKFLSENPKGKIPLEKPRRKRESSINMNLKEINKSGWCELDSSVRFEFLTAASMKMTAFWRLVPCSLVKVYRRFSAVYSSP
jgi:hypothetical protein